MKKLLVLLPVLIAGSLAACGTAPEPRAAVATDRAMLLVSLDDGSVVLQMIDSDADICFKHISRTATTCLSQGAAIVNAESNTVIGFEMHEEQIDLVAGSNH